jgi:hypothetical protein
VVSTASVTVVSLHGGDRPSRTGSGCCSAVY